MSATNPSPIGVIAGTGFRTLAPLTEPRTETIESAYGSVEVTRGRWHEQEVVFLPRHGSGHTVPPHLINYRANIDALRQLGCSHIIAVNVVGGIDPALTPGTLVLVDDFLDFTRGREHTFHTGGEHGVVHVDVTEAYDPALRAQIHAAATQSGIPLVDGGVYACFDGPRFETPAEIRLAALAGGSVVGMTGVPEVSLAVEAGLPYAAISLVVNPAAGLSDEPISMTELEAVLAASSANVLTVLDAFFASTTA